MSRPKSGAFTQETDLHCTVHSIFTGTVSEFSLDSVLNQTFIATGDYSHGPPASFLENE